MSSEYESKKRHARRTRRDFLKVIGGTGAVLSATDVLAQTLGETKIVPKRAPVIHRHPGAGHEPNPTAISLPYLDRNMYIHNMEVIAHVPGRRNAGIRMMNIGPQRLAFSGSDVIDVTDPRNPTIINAGKSQGGELGYNAKIKKWVMIRSVAAPSPGEPPGGKYEDPSVVQVTRDYKGLRGIRLFDVTDPTNVNLLSEYSTGQTGSGPHGDSNYWDGGKYCYLGSAPDDTFTHNVAQSLLYSNCLMIVDVSDPMAVKPVANWWVPGQRNDEVEEMKKWRVLEGRVPTTLESTKTLEAATKAFRALKFNDASRTPRTWFHGPMYVPTRVEDGGTRGYGAWDTFGFLIHDLSDITKLKMVGRYETTRAYGLGEGIPFHNIWTATLERGFVVGSPESINPDCNEVYQESWVIDIRDEAHPTPIAVLPRPKAPDGAPYVDFCSTRGRFGPHAPPPPNTPGRNTSLLPMAFFNGGLQLFDLTVPTQPKIVAYFVPPQAGTLSPECRAPHEQDAQTEEMCCAESSSYYRQTDECFVEWDRNLLYACTASGLYILSSPALGKPVLEGKRVTQWGAPGVNIGAT